MRRTSLVVLLLSALMLGACQSRKTESVTLGLEAMDRTAYYDIPLPLGFKETYDPLAFQSFKPVRKAYMHFKGGSYYVDVVQFYIDSLPESGWKFENQEFSLAATTLRYSKGIETLSLKVYAATKESQIIMKLASGPLPDDD